VGLVRYASGFATGLLCRNGPSCEGGEPSCATHMPFVLFLCPVQFTSLKSNWPVEKNPVTAFNPSLINGIIKFVDNKKL